jgi:hypothetical protein
MIKNKKADERLLSVYLFIIYAIVSIGFVSGVLLFHGAGLDIRVAEAGVLSDKIIDCLVKGGVLINPVLNESLNNTLDIEELCNFDFRDNSESYGGSEQMGARISVFGFGSCSKNGDEVSCNDLKKTLTIGRDDFFIYCDERGDKIPKCSEKWMYVLNEKGEKLMLKILSVVRKVEKND